MSTDLFMRRKDGKSRSRGLVLVRCAQGPKGDRSTAELSEPAFKLRLGCVMRETTHVKNFASLLQEGPYISPCVHWPGQDIRMVLGWLRLSYQSSQHPR